MRRVVALLALGAGAVLAQAPDPQGPQQAEPERFGYRAGGAKVDEAKFWIEPLRRANERVARAEAEKGPWHVDTARELSYSGRAHAQAIQYAEARRIFERALQVYERALGPEHSEAGAAHADLGRLWRAVGQFKDARPHFDRAYAIAIKHYGVEHPSSAEMATLVSVSMTDEGDYAGALKLVESAAEIQERFYKRINCPVATSLSHMAFIHGAMGHPELAVPILQRVIAGMEAELRSPMPPDRVCLANRQSDLGATYKRMGQYSDALAAYNKAAQTYAVALGKDSLGFAQALARESILLTDLGQGVLAVEAARASHALTEKLLGTDHPATGQSLKMLGYAVSGNGDHEEARRLFARSNAIYEKVFGPEHRFVANGLVLLALEHNHSGDRSQAVQLVDRAVAILEFSLGPRHPETAGTMLDAATLHRAAGNPGRAAALTEAAFLASTASRILPTRARAETMMAESLAERGEPAAAIFIGKQAVNSMQEMRMASRSLDVEFRKSLLEKLSKPYRTLAGWLIDSGRLPEAQQVLAMLKEDELHEYTRRSDTRDPRSTRADLTGVEEKAKAQLDAAVADLSAKAREYEALRRRVAERLADEPDKARLTQLETDLVAGRKAFDSALGYIRRQMSAMTAERAAEVGEKGLANLRALQGTLKSLGAGTVMVTYVALDKELLILVTTPGTQVARRSPVTSTELNHAVHLYRAELQNPATDVKAGSSKLYKWLIEPIVRDLRESGASTLMLSLDGALRYLPFAALHDGERFLVESYRSAVHTEAARDKLKDVPAAEWRLAAMGTSLGHPGFVALPSVRGELQAVAKTPASPAGALPGTITLDADFTRAALKHALAQETPVLHLASHFVFKPGTDDDSFLLMGDGSRLSLRQLKDEDYDFRNVDLLTLSACETALGGGVDADGREVEGLGVLAQRQGAKGVLATLWPVADDGTALFMSRMYRLRAADGVSKAEAVRRSQLTMLQDKSGRYAHPFFWAPFILMGNWR